MHIKVQVLVLYCPVSTRQYHVKAKLMCAENQILLKQSKLFKANKNGIYIL